MCRDGFGSSKICKIPVTLPATGLLCFPGAQGRLPEITRVGMVSPERRQGGVNSEPSDPSHMSGRRTRLSITTVEPAAPDGIEFRLLGPVEAKLAGEAVPVAGTRQISVLAALALGVGRVVTMARLAHAVWDGVPPPTARAQVQAAVLRLRRWLPGLVRTTAHGYLLAAAGRQVDAEVFRGLSAQAWAAARDRRPAEAAVLFRSALGLWRGSALDGVTGLGADAAKLEEQRVSVVTGLFAAELGTG